MEVIFIVLLVSLFSHSANAQIIAPSGVDMGAAKSNFVCRSDASCSKVDIGSFSVGGSTLVVANGNVSVGGKLGVGNTNPDTKLHVSSGTIKVDGNTQDSIIVSGRVGIGTNAPQVKLHIREGTDLNLWTRTNGGYMQTLGINDAGNAYIPVRLDGIPLQLNNASGGGTKLAPKTKAQIFAFDPVEVGEMIFCTDCTASNICISTGTAVGQFSDIQAKTVDCQ